MSKAEFRTPAGGRIDRGRPVNFTFNGRALQGYAGDTLASALLANGIHLVARSFKYTARAASSPPVRKSRTR